MGFFLKGRSAWAVILRRAPDFKAEQALSSVFTEKLQVSAEDASKIIRAAPIILFHKRSHEEAQQIKMALGETGAEVSLSKDSNELKKLQRLVWPKRIDAKIFAPKLAPRPGPPRPIPPPRPTPTPVAPPKAVTPPSPSEDWKARYETLDKTHREIRGELERLQKERLELEQKISTLEMKLKILTEESERKKSEASSLSSDLDRLRKELTEALQARQEAQKTADALRKEVISARDLRETLQREVNTLRLEKERTNQEFEKLRTEIAAELEKILLRLRTPVKFERNANAKARK